MGVVFFLKDLPVEYLNMVIPKHSEENIRVYGRIGE
jgi:hypothetical protein